MSLLKSCIPEKDLKEDLLVLAGIELIFFIAAGMVLCFGFVIKTVLVTRQCFSYC